MKSPEPGDKVTWSFVPRGGYGYGVALDAVVLTLTAKRVKIRVATLNPQGQWITQNKIVQPKSLRPRKKHNPHVDD